MIVEISLYRDAMTPTIEALVLENDGGGIRLTSMKWCGRWIRVKTFRCLFIAHQQTAKHPLYQR